MASVKLFQDAIVIKSEITKEQYDNVCRFAPNALTLFKDEKKSEPVAVIGFGPSGGINNNGIVYDNVAEDGKLTVTLMGENNTGLTQQEKLDELINKFAIVIDNANLIEAQVTETLEALAARINGVKDSFSIVE